jgi:mannose-6-phosphate isomerase-like protein (cupin superfamily)/SAM-dependent methyltransferase
MSTVVNIERCFERFSDTFSPKIVADLNGQHVKVVRVEGDKVPWHTHDHEDELFWVHEGELDVLERERTVTLRAGEFCVVPRGVEHKVIPRGHVKLILFEPDGIAHTRRRDRRRHRRGSRPDAQLARRRSPRWSAFPEGHGPSPVPARLVTAPPRGAPGQSALRLRTRRADRDLRPPGVSVIGWHALDCRPIHVESAFPGRRGRLALRDRREGIMDEFNVYADARRAESYARLDFPGTYYLAYRDLPALFRAHARGTRALDLGCGAGRSTRFLAGHGFAAVGVDISASMIAQARNLDPGGDYRLLEHGDLRAFADASFDLVLSAFTFDNIPTRAEKHALLAELRRVLGREGVLVNLVSSPEIYLHEWASFSTRDYPENARAKSGDEVRIVITDTDDPRPVVDVLTTAEDYRRLFAATGFEIVAIHRPLGRDDEPVAWVNETRIPPWTIHVVRGAGDAADRSGDRTSDRTSDRASDRSGGPAGER